MGNNKTKVKKIPELLLISDPNCDADDLISFVTAAALADKKLIKLAGVLTTCGDYILRVRRAKYAKGAFISLGYPFLKVCSGADYETSESGPDHFFASTLEGEALERAGQVIERNPQQMFQGALQRATDKSLVIVINAQMNDVANMLISCGEKNLKKIARVVLMGNGIPGDDPESKFRPHPNSYNNKVCMTGAEKLFDFAQEHNIRLVFVPKEVVYQVQVERGFYDRLEALKHPVAQAIVAGNKKCLENLWKSIRSGDYSHFDLRRFAKVFMGEDYKLSSRKISGKMSFEEIWPKIKYLNLYDPLAVLVAADEAFQPFGRTPRQSEKYMVYQTLINDAEGLRNFLYDLILGKLDN